MERAHVARYVRIAISAMSLTACVLLIALWVRSYWRAHRLHWSIGAKESVALASNEGRLVLLWYLNVTQPNAWKAGFYSHPIADEQSFPTRELDSSSHFGVGILRQPPYFVPEVKEQVAGKPGVTRVYQAGYMYLKGSGVMIPHWFLILLTGALTTVPWIHWSTRFSLRTMLIATTLVAVVLGVIVYASR